MGVNFCPTCGSSTRCTGSGHIKDPGAPWWAFWRTIVCPDCGGDGYAKPPGWPDPIKMKQLRPKPPQGYNYYSRKNSAGLQERMINLD